MGMPHRTPALILFDIDGTLLRRAGPHHREALSFSIQRIFGIEASTEGVPVAGMLDRDILTAILHREGVSPSQIKKAMPRLVNEAELVYQRTCPDLRKKVCPGVRGLLYKISRRGIPASLVTGNFSSIGWKKMERAGLRHYFAHGAFAEMATDRAGLVKIAIQHARRQGWIQKDSPIALLGDHPNDIRAAKANGVRAVAVATGIIGAEELMQHAPDLLVEDMRGLTVERALGLMP
jgi:phosphoglycolate phosphatase